MREFYQGYGINSPERLFHVYGTNFSKNGQKQGTNSRVKALLGKEKKVVSFSDMLSESMEKLPAMV